MTKAITTTSLLALIIFVVGFSMNFISGASGQLVLNTPPIIKVLRNWRIPETQEVNSIITHVDAEDNENDILEFGLDANVNDGFNNPNSEAAANIRLPFRINATTGFVYLNESLVGRGGENFLLYVTVGDGSMTAKTAVYVNIFPKNITNFYSSRTPPFIPQTKNLSKLFPQFNQLPVVQQIQHEQQQQQGQQNIQQIPLNIFTNSQPQPNIPNVFPPFTINNHHHPNPGQNSFDIIPTINDGAENNGLPSLFNNRENSFQGPTGSRVSNETRQQSGASNGSLPPYQQNNGVGFKSNTTHLTAVPNQNRPYSKPGSGDLPSFDSASSKKGESERNQDDYTVKAILPVIVTICGIFLVAGLIALFVYRKHLCAIGKSLKKKSKEEMAKKSNQSNISSTEDSRNSMVLQHWNGPMAFSNRYVPWERDNQHALATSQLSTSSSTGNSQTKTDRWEFPRHRLKFFNILGEGAFGQVWRCEATDIDGTEGITTVAVKTLKENATEVERNDLYSELQVMKSLEPHVNVVRLLGSCTDKSPLFVIIEYVNCGKLQSYLRKSRAERHYGNTHGKSNILTSGDLTSFMYQVARGMEFLTSRGIIHRDLAARNILIADDHTCKVADFGFARDVITSKVYERKSEGKLPIRWMAVESLYDNIFSVKSDIWSFGILMWEIVTLGSTPYPGISAADVMRKVRDGYRLEKPEHCRRELYNIMYYCWAKDSNERPSFSEVVQLLDKLLLTEMEYIELERFPDHNYYNMLSLSGEKL